MEKYVFKPTVSSEAINYQAIVMLHIQLWIKQDYVSFCFQLWSQDCSVSCFLLLLTGQDERGDISMSGVQGRVSLAIHRMVLMSPRVTFHQGFVTTKIFVPLLFTFYQAMLEIDSWDGLGDGCLKMVVCSCPCHPLSHLNTNIFTWIYISCHQTHRWLQTNKELQHINVKVDSVKQ